MFFIVHIQNKVLDVKFENKNKSGIFIILFFESDIKLISHKA